MQEMLEMFWNTLAVIGVLAGLMIVALAIGYLYVMNEFRNEINQEKCRAKKYDMGGDE